MTTAMRRATAMAVVTALSPSPDIFLVVGVVVIFIVVFIVVAIVVDDGDG